MSYCMHLPPPIPRYDVHSDYFVFGYDVKNTNTSQPRDNIPFERYEDLFIRARYHEKQFTVLSKALERSEESIHQRAFELGLNVLSKTEAVTISNRIHATVYSIEDSESPLMTLSLTSIAPIPPPSLSLDELYNRNSLLSSFEELECFNYF